MQQRDKVKKWIYTLFAAFKSFHTLAASITSCLDCSRIVLSSFLADNAPPVLLVDSYSFSANERSFCKQSPLEAMAACRNSSVCCLFSIASLQLPDTSVKRTIISFTSSIWSIMLWRPSQAAFGMAPQSKHQRLNKKLSYKQILE